MADQDKNKMKNNNNPKELAEEFTRKLSLASRSVHADDYINNHQAVAPPMHVSTTFRYSRDPDNLVPWSNLNVCLFLVPPPPLFCWNE